MTEPTPKLGLTGRASAASARHPWRTIAIWVVLAAALMGASGAMGGVFTTDISFTSKPESQRSRDILKEWQGEPLFESLVVSSEKYAVKSPEFQKFVTEITAALRQHPNHIDPTQTSNVYELAAVQPGAELALISKDGHATLVNARVLGDVDTAVESVAALDGAVEPFRANKDFTILRGGFISANEAFTTASEVDLKSEQYVLPIAMVILIIVFGALVAALAPMFIGVFAIMLAIASVTLISQISPLSIFVTNVVTMIGLAVGIDYALFTIARYREQRHAGFDVERSIAIAGDTASRAVVFSGATVVIALSGLILVPNTIFRAFGIGSSIVVIFAVLATLTLLPAALRLLGDRIEDVHPAQWQRLAALATAAGVIVVPGPGRGVLAGVTFAVLFLPAIARGVMRVAGGRRAAPVATLHMSANGNGENGFWAGTARFVMRNAPVMATGSAMLLIVLAVPYAKIHLGSSGPSALPEDYEVKQAFEVLNEKFVPGFLAPTDIVILAPDVKAPAIQQAILAFQQRVSQDPEIRLSRPPVASDDATRTALGVALTGDLASEQAQNQVKRLREDIIPAAFSQSGAEVLVGGTTAINIDLFAQVKQYTPIVFAYVLGLSFILLMLVFRSIVVPIKSIIMNLLSVGAAYGVLIAVFQWGWAPSFMGFGKVDAIEAWLPLMMFTILFGLSMDYHVFLISRIRERYDETHQNTESVAFGLRSTANIITGAAAIMVAVFGGFALGDLVMFQQMGLGLAVAVFLDATIVRTVLVPATMRLLGDTNWYLPAWLHWLPDLRVEQSPHASKPMASGVAGDGGV
ncbi:MAG: MMPL family transporter [Dehalococcoidia bacterium]|nr:MAG: MMPL family transporter [Dehalococcoidia bacterium]